MKKITLSDEMYQAALMLYKSGLNLKTAAKQAGTSEEVFRRELKERGDAIPRAHRISEGKCGVKIKHHALDTLTPEAMYWIGFLYADGHIEKGRNRITLTLAEKDKEHLNKFSNFFTEGLEMRQVVKAGIGNHGYMNSNAYRVGFSSDRLHQILSGYGFTYKKTYDISPDFRLKDSKHFWRGVVDGDGWVYTGQSKYSWGIGLCGHYNTMVEFLAFLRRSGVETKASPTKSKKSEHLWTVELHSHVATKVGKLLYQDSTIYLDRKYEKYISWLDKK